MIRFFIEYRFVWIIFGVLFIGLEHFLNFLTGAYQIQNSLNFGIVGKVEISPLISIILSSGFILINAFNLSRIFNENDFYEKTIYSTGILYIVLMSLFHSFYCLNIILIVHFILILVLREMLLIKQQEGDLKHVFNGAFLLGVGICINPPNILFVPVYILSIWNFKSLTFRDLILILLGLILPLLFVGSKYFINDKIIIVDLFNSLSNWKIIIFDMLLTLIFLCFLFLFAFVSFRSNTIKSTLRLRKIMFPIWFFFILGLLYGTYDIVFFYQIERIALVLITLPFLINYSFVNRSFNLFSGVLFILVIGYSFVKFFTVLPHR